MTEEETKGNMPEKKFRCGGITATVWSNTIIKDGENKKYHSVNIEKSYKDKSDQWQKTQSLSIKDLPKVALVTAEAYKYLTLKTE